MAMLNQMRSPFSSIFCLVSRCPNKQTKKVYKQGKHYKEIFQLNYFCWRGRGKESDPDIAAKEKITEIEDW